MALIGCASGPKATIVELENKGTSMNVDTPDWIRLYVAQGISAVQAQPQYRDKYCIIGEENSLNRQFAVTWADNFSAQQRIGQMLRTSIASEYQAHVQGTSQSSGGANSSTAAGTGSADYRQEIDNVLSAIVTVSYVGAQREADWWSLRRRYDPDLKDVFSDEYTAYVLYTIPKAEMNRQIAEVLTTSIKADSVLYDITIDMARQILQNGLAQWGAGETSPSSDPNRSVATPASATPTASATATSGSAIQDGTYTFWPRPRAMREGRDINMYLDRIVVRGGFFNMYFVATPTGVSTNSPDMGNWAAYSFSFFLQDTDQPSRQPLQAQNYTTEYANDGVYSVITFTNHNIKRFTLTQSLRGETDPAPRVLEAIVIGDPDA